MITFIKIKYFLLILFLTIILLPILNTCSTPGEESFNFFDMTPVEIENYSPDQEFISNQNINISIEFSKPMSTKSVESAFSYKEDGNTINGSFNWSDGDKKLTFIPKKECLFGKKYTFSLSTAAEDKNGNDLKRALEQKFQLGSDIVLPYVVKEQCVPQPNANLDVITQLREPIIIVFSEAMDKPYPYNNFKITPDIEGDFEWLDNTGNPVDQFSTIPSSRLRFTPRSDYTKQKYYEVSVQDTFTDLNKNKLRESYTFKFYVGNDFIIPDIVSVTALSGSTPDPLQPSGPGYTPSYTLNTDIEKDDSFIILFTKEMDKESTEQAITTVPSVPLEYVWNATSDEVTVELKKDKGVITQYYESNKTYKLVITDSAKDLTDNNLTGTYQYYFLIDGENSQQPEIAELNIEYSNGIDVYVDDILSDAYYISTKKYIINCNNWDLEDATEDLTFELNFTGMPGLELNFTSLINNISFATVGIENTSLEVAGYDHAPGSLIYTFFVEASGSAQGSLDPDTTIVMTITGGKDGIKDMNNNYMADTLIVYLVFDYL